MSNSKENHTSEELEQIVLKHVLGDAEIEKLTTRLGISIYPEHSTPKKDRAYLELAAKYGFTRMFTCLLSADESVETIIVEFTAINGYASEAELKAVGDVNLNKTVFKIVPEATLTAIETKILYDDIHLAREDGAYVKRDMISRFINKKATIEPNCCPETLHYGDVIILNNRLAHYAGELQIVTAKTLNNDGRYNRVGTIVEDELMMIDLLSPNDLFGFTTT